MKKITPLVRYTTVQCGEEVNFVYSVAKVELRKVECSDFWIKAVPCLCKRIPVTCGVLPQTITVTILPQHPPSLQLPSADTHTQPRIQY